MEYRDHYDSEPPKHETKDIMLFEQQIAALLFSVAAKFSGKIKSFQMMRDDDFVRRKDRTTNDIHLFFELNNEQIFHLRAYTRHMLEVGEIPKDRIFLTGYQKPSIAQTGGEHSLNQAWYKWDSDLIAQGIIAQNPSLF